MSSTTSNHTPSSADHAHDEAHVIHEPKHYIKIWAILCVLLCVSIIGPTFGIKIVTLITAFGIAFVKAYLVAKEFMHLNVQKPYVIYMLVTCLVFMVLMFAGISPDVMKHSGANWVNVAARDVQARAEAEAAAGGGHGGVEQGGVEQGGAEHGGAEHGGGTQH